jgi:hypothetical protein
VLAVGSAWAAGAAPAAAAATGADRIHVEPEVNFGLPPTTAGCGGVTPWPPGGQRIPLTVSTVAGQVAESVNVCLGGRGPFPFVLDTGAGQSTIDAGLARRLHLPRAGPPVTFAGVGCTGQARPVSVASWSLEGIPLAGQALTAATLPQMGGKGQPVGLLGSDVLSRFGAVRVDFAAGSLVVPGPEGSPLPTATSERGPTGPAPSDLTGGGGRVVPLTVLSGGGNVSLGVSVQFGRRPGHSFVVDTGTSQTVLSTALVRAHGLSSSDLAQRQATVCSVVTVPLVHSGPWSMPGVTLVPQLVGATSFGTLGTGVQGLLGSDVLKGFGWAVLDYQGAQMVLG